MSPQWTKCYCPQKIRKALFGISGEEFGFFLFVSNLGTQNSLSLPGLVFVVQQTHGIGSGTQRTRISPFSLFGKGGEEGEKSQEPVWISLEF